MSVTQNNHDRNLIFGIVALHLDFIKQDQLIAAMQEWLLDKSRTLGEILVKQGVLSESRKGMLSMLVEEHLQQHGNDPVRSLNTFGNLAPLREELQSMGDPDIYRAASLMPGVQAGAEMALATMAHAPERKPKGETRFSVVRRLAEGGLGVVWVAIDSELVREVALKEIKPQFADHGNSRARFLQEAEITGRLEHPGIVPVYGLGKYLDGRPYYAMRMIKGESLQSAIEQFYEAKGRTATQQALAQRELLQRFVDVCDAIEYAHSRGILHRDLKPDNVMLGKYGETLVVDWGLAKAIGEADLKTRSDETVIMPELGGDSVPTRMGEVVGTIAFMSPEQAAGKHRELTPASDIFSLGAILYNIITGVPAQKRGTMPELLRNVREGKFPRPREVNPAAPAALEAICLKAMAQLPQDRYTSAQQLAADIERFLADEPVAVYREPALQRFRRWTRQHPKTVTSLAVGSVLLIGGAIVFSWSQARANRLLAVEKSRVEESNEELEQTNKKLDTTIEYLEVANKRSENVREFLVEVFKSPNPSIGGKDLTVFAVLEPKLEEVLAGKDELLRNDREYQAVLLHTLGESFLGLGIYDEAIRANKEALRIRQDVLGGLAPDTLDSINNLAVTYQRAGMLSEAEALLETTFQATRKVRGAMHADTAIASINLATLYYDEKRYEEAIPYFEEALRIAEQVGFADARYGAMTSLGACYDELRQFDKALPMAIQAYDGLLEKLGNGNEQTLKAMNSLGLLYGDLERFDEAIELLMRGQEICQRPQNFGADHPLTVAFMKTLARVHQSAGHNEEAIKLYRESYTRGRDKSHLQTRDTMRRWTSCYLDIDEFAKAETVARKWLDTTAKLAEPDLSDQARAQSYLAMACLDQGKLAEAREQAEAAQAFFKSQQQASADQLRAQVIMGLVLGKQEQIENAESLLADAYQLAERLVRSINRDTFETVTSLGHRVEEYFTANGDSERAGRWRDLIKRIQLPVSSTTSGASSQRS